MDTRHGELSLLDWGLNDRELTHARQVLREDERVVLVLRPQIEADAPQRWQFIVFLCFFALVVVAAQLASEHPFSFLVGVFLCVPGCCIMAGRWRKEYGRCRTFYMLTRQRALVMQATLRGYRPCSYPLREGMVESVAVRGDGSGNIVFAEQKTWYINKQVRDEVQQLGFLDIAQVKWVQQVLEQCVREKEEASDDGME